MLRRGVEVEAAGSGTAPQPAFEQVLREILAEHHRAEATVPRAAGLQLKVPAALWLQSGTRALQGAAVTRAYAADDDHCEWSACGVAGMQGALRAFETALAARRLSGEEIRRLRRVVAAVLHPDLHDGADKPLAEQLMKQANVLASAALEGAVE